MEYVKAIPLTPAQVGGETKIQELISADPSILGLSDDVKLLEREKTVFSGGRLDVLLDVPGNNKRYTVEVQLGKCDPDHIIRTIEYWDLLRKREPGYEYIAVLVAEQLTNRFFNVIRLIGDRLPLIAIQMSCFEVDGKATVTFTTVQGLSPEQSGESADDRGNSKEAETGWRKWAGPEIMKVVDGIFEVAKTCVPGLRLKFTQSYVSIKRGESNANTAVIWPQKRQVRMGLVIPKPDPRSEQLEKLFAAAGMPFSYDSSWGAQVFSVSPALFVQNKDLFQEAMTLAFSE
jgi:hypothetical protein